MGDILQPAIDLAKHGFPVHPVAAHFWNAGCSCLKNPRNKHGSDLLLNGEAPRAGDIMKMPLLASTFEVSILSSRLSNAMLRVTWLKLETVLFLVQSKCRYSISVLGYKKGTQGELHCALRS